MVTHEQIFHELGRINTRLDANAEQRAEMLASIVEVNANTKHIAVQIKAAGTRMEEVAGRVSALELTGAERRGERGVLAAITPDHPRYGPAAGEPAGAGSGLARIEAAVLTLGVVADVASSTRRRQAMIGSF